MAMKTIHCRVCGVGVRGINFASRMQKLRTHYRDVHPTKWKGWEHLKARLPKLRRRRIRRKPKRGSEHMSPEPERRRRRRYAPRRAIRRVRRGLARGLGRGLGLKALVAGTAGLIVMQRFQPFGGVYKPAIDKAALGIVLPMVKLDNQDMLSVGIKEGIATLVNQYLGGAAAPTGGGAL